MAHTDPTSAEQPTGDDARPDDVASSAPSALVLALEEVDRHLGLHGWDQPTRLYALALTNDLVTAQPALAASLQLSSSAGAGALTPVEQDPMPADVALDTWLAGIGWPPDVLGCALAQEVLTLPPSVEADIPDGDDAVAWAATHPLRREVRMIVGVLRDGTRASILRVRGTAGSPDDVVSGEALVPRLADALAATLDD